MIALKVWNLAPLLWSSYWSCGAAARPAIGIAFRRALVPVPLFLKNAAPLGRLPSETLIVDHPLIPGDVKSWLKSQD